MKVSDKNYGLPFLHNKRKGTYRFFWKFVAWRFFVILIVVCCVCLAIDILDSDILSRNFTCISNLKSLLGNISDYFKSVIFKILERFNLLEMFEIFKRFKILIYACYEQAVDFEESNRLSLFSVSLTLTTFTLTLVNFVFDGKSVAGLKRDIINRLLDNNFLSWCRTIMAIIPVLSLFSAIFSLSLFHLSLTFCSIVIALVEMQICFCYALSKPALIHDISLHLLCFVIADIDKTCKLLETTSYTSNCCERNKKKATFSSKILEDISSRLNFSNLISSLCSTVSPVPSVEQHETEEVIMYFISNLCGLFTNKSELLGFSREEKKILHTYEHILSSVGFSYLYFHVHHIFKEYFGQLKISSTDYSENSQLLLNNCMSIIMDSVMFKAYTNTLNNDTKYFYIAAGMICGALDSGCPLSNIYEALSVAKENQPCNTTKIKNLISGLSLLMLIWNEYKIMHHGYWNYISEKDDEYNRRYADTLANLFYLSSKYTDDVGHTLIQSNNISTTYYEMYYETAFSSILSDKICKTHQYFICTPPYLSDINNVFTFWSKDNKFNSQYNPYIFESIINVYDSILKSIGYSYFSIGVFNDGRKLGIHSFPESQSLRIALLSYERRI